MLTTRKRYIRIFRIFVIITLALYLMIYFAAMSKIPNIDLETQFEFNSIISKAEEHILTKREESYQSDIEDELNNIKNKFKTCDIDLQKVPQPKIQMLNLYNQMSFPFFDSWSINFDSSQYNNHNKLKVFVVPHSHNDPGWRMTFEGYYDHKTKFILYNALEHLQKNPEMKFIWAEISYFSKFYEKLKETEKQGIKKLVQNGQLEFVSGGWVMPDEANSHWYNLVLQLTEGQHWLKKFLNVTPTTSWAIDPFGHSPSMPYVLKKSGFQNALIQRTHFLIKKQLGMKKSLEFNWRQLWDDTGSTDLFTHMMPFLSYGINYSCGPDNWVCVQFDFRSVSGLCIFGYCTWKRQQTTINDQNIANKAKLLVDQWKKKAELYRSNVVLVPLGDDFRFSDSTEWDEQRINYGKLFAHINNDSKYFVEAKFATLQEYFDAVHQEEKQKQLQFPTLSGDFFTYADRSDNYWSGYYTSRPYHKRMDRVLMHYIRSAEMLSSWHNWDATTKFDEMLQEARRQLALFQHHDGITGTARRHVVRDYYNRMLESIKSCKLVMQQSVYRLLTKPSIYIPDYNFTYFDMDDSRWPGPNEGRTTIVFIKEFPQRHLVFHNSLPQWREDIVDFYVSSPYVSVVDSNKNPVYIQISPVWTWEENWFLETITPKASNIKYKLIFKAKVPPLGLSTYLVKVETSRTIKSDYTSFTTNIIYTKYPFTSQLSDDYPIKLKTGEPREIILKVGSENTVAFTSEGMMKSIKVNKSEAHKPVKVQFLKYGIRSNDQTSGAYLFLPNGPAQPIVNAEPPVVLVTKGPLESSVSTGLTFGIHQTILREGEAPEIRNTIDIRDMDNTEVVMRIQTDIKNKDKFYTDLNGLQFIKRQRFAKIPLQANYYPIPSGIYMEDNSRRFTVLTAQPLGGSSLVEGEVEIMQDRRLSYGDGRGLGEGVLDNLPVLNIFRIVLEKIDSCEKMAVNHPSGILTLTAYRNSKSILDPLDKFIYNDNIWLGLLPDFGTKHSSLNDDMEIMVMRNLPVTSVVPVVPKVHKTQNIGLIVHRTKLLQCTEFEMENRGKLNLHHLLQWDSHNVPSVLETTLTFLQRLSTQKIDEDISVCPMDSLAFILQKYS